MCLLCLPHPSSTKHERSPHMSKINGLQHLDLKHHASRARSEAKELGGGLAGKYSCSLFSFPRCVVAVVCISTYRLVGRSGLGAVGVRLSSLGQNKFPFLSLRTNCTVNVVMVIIVIIVITVLAICM